MFPFSTTAIRLTRRRVLKNDKDSSSDVSLLFQGEGLAHHLEGDIGKSQF